LAARFITFGVSREKISLTTTAPEAARVASRATNKRIIVLATFAARSANER